MTNKAGSAPSVMILTISQSTNVVMDMGSQESILAFSGQTFKQLRHAKIKVPFLLRDVCIVREF